MKEIFFKGLAVAVPVLVLAALAYWIFQGFYELYADIQLKRELEQIRRESAERRRQKQQQEREEPPEPAQHPE